MNYGAPASELDGISVSKKEGGGRRKKKKKKKSESFYTELLNSADLSGVSGGNTFNLSLIYSRKGKNKKYPEKQKNTKKRAREREREKKEIEYNEEVEGRERC